MYDEPLDRFDPDNVSPKTMKALQTQFQRYLDEIVDGIMIPSEDMDPREWKRMQEGAEVVRELIKKLKKKDTRVFVLDAE